LLGSSVVETAWADASAPDKAAARELGIAGIQLADRGDCTGAVAKLQKAAELYPAPTIVERLGECQIALGKIVAGTESLQSVLHQDLGPSPNPVFVDAQKRAQRALEAARPRIGRIVIHLTGPKPEDANVTVDGERVPAALLDAERPTDPGAHQVAAAASGFTEAASTVTVREGGRAEVTLTLQPSAAPPGPPTVPPPSTVPPSPGAPPPPPPATPPGVPPTAEGGGGGGGGSLAFPIAAFVIGAAGFTVGGIFGGLAMNKKSSLDLVCDSSKSCPSESQSDIDSLKTNATVATAGFIAGGLGVGVGLIALVTRSSGASVAPAAPHGTLTPVLGPTSLGVRGSF
jgi:hypothetical protein